LIPNNPQTTNNTFSTNLAEALQQQTNSLPPSPNHNMFMGGNGAQQNQGAVSPGDCGSMDNLLQQQNGYSSNGGGNSAGIMYNGGMIEKKFCVTNPTTNPMELGRAGGVGNSGNQGGATAQNVDSEENGEVWQDIVRQLAVS
jgi:hypothetical protein